MIAYYTHVNSAMIRSGSEPALIVRRGRSGKAAYASRVKLPEGSELIHCPNDPLPCGARAFIVSPTQPEILA